MAKDTTTAIATLDQCEYTALNPIKMQEFGVTIPELLREAVGPTGRLTAFDLERIVTPAGGGAFWEMQDGEGGKKAVKEIVGVLVAQRDSRTFWFNSIEDGGGGTPPDCFSDDGIRGTGAVEQAMVEGQGLVPINSGRRLCDQCDFSKFGSDEAGRGQACKQSKLLFFLVKDRLLPLLIAVPPTSLAAWRKFVLGQISLGKRPSQLEIGLSLEEDKNQKGIKFSRVKPRIIRTLGQEEADALAAYGAAFMRTLSFSVADAFKTIDAEAAQE